MADLDAGGGAMLMPFDAVATAVRLLLGGIALSICAMDASAESASINVIAMFFIWCVDVIILQR
jgi:hypothetical protein